MPLCIVNMGHHEVRCHRHPYPTSSIRICLCPIIPNLQSTTTTTTTTALNTVWDDYIGGQDFKGGKFYFDPLNLAETYKLLVPFFREAEIRHGRTAILAVVGFIATDFVRLPGNAYSFAAIPKTVDAHNALLHAGPMY